MAEKRMFANSVVDSDRFLEMPISSQALYFHLGMKADDDGFVSSPKKIARVLRCSDDDLKMLIAKNYIIPFDSGVVVITDWNINNKLRADRRKKTICINERALLAQDKSGRYLLGGEELAVSCQSNDGQQADESPRSIEECNIEKNSLLERECSADAPAREQSKAYGEYNRVHLTDLDYSGLVKEFGEDLLKAYIKRVDLYCQSKNKEYSDYCAVIRAWIKEDRNKPGFDEHRKPSYDIDEWSEWAENLDIASHVNRK